MTKRIWVISIIALFSISFLCGCDEKIPKLDWTLYVHSIETKDVIFSTRIASDYLWEPQYIWRDEWVEWKDTTGVWHRQQFPIDTFYTSCTSDPHPSTHWANVVFEARKKVYHPVVSPWSKPDKTQ